MVVGDRHGDPVLKEADLRGRSLMPRVMPKEAHARRCSVAWDRHT